MIDNSLDKEYLDSNGLDFINKINKPENREWFARFIRILRERFDQADH